jgi:hypothetical protein
MAASTTTNHEALSGISSRSMDAAIRSREEDTRGVSVFLASTNGSLALHLAGVAHELPEDMTIEEAYLLGAADLARTVLTHHDAIELEAALAEPSTASL